MNFEAGDVISFENTDNNCDSGFIAAELHFADVTISPPFIASVMGSTGEICEKSNSANC